MECKSSFSVLLGAFLNKSKILVQIVCTACSSILNTADLQLHRAMRTIRKASERAAKISSTDAECKGCSKIIDKFDELDSAGLSFEKGRTLEEGFEIEYEEHMRMFHKMIR